METLANVFVSLPLAFQVIVVAGSIIGGIAFFAYAIDWIEGMFR